MWYKGNAIGVWSDMLGGILKMMICIIEAPRNQELFLRTIRIACRWDQPTLVLVRLALVKEPIPEFWILVGAGPGVMLGI